MQCLSLSVHDQTQILKTFPDEEQAPAAWLMSNWCPKGKELKAILQYEVFS